MRIVSGAFRNRKLVTPKGFVTRPSAETLREALFNIGQHAIADANVLDLFAGSGALGLEALSRGAQHATFVDSDKGAIRCIRSNIASLGLELQTTIIAADVFLSLEMLQRQGLRYDLILADPPYGDDAQRVLNVIDNADLLNDDALVFIECAKKMVLNTSKLAKLSLSNTRRIGSAVLYLFNAFAQ